MSTKSSSQPLKIGYWITTSFIGVMMIFSAYSYIAMEQAKEGFVHLGFPDYFRLELAAAKALGGLALLLPCPPRIKEWAYAGFAITFVSAFIAHAVVDGPMTAIGSIVAMILLSVSYVFGRKLGKI